MKRLSCLVLLTLAGGCSSPKPETIWVGHLIPLSGPEGERGEESVRAIQSALEQSRADDFSVARRPVGVRHVDSASENARAEATRLLAVNGVCALIVGPGAKNVEELIAAARSSAAPVIVLDEVDEPTAYAGLVLLGPDPLRRGEETAAHLSRRDVKQVVLIADSSRPKCRAVADSFARHFKGEPRRWDVADLKRPEALAEMKRQAPAAVVLAAPGDWCVASRKTLRETFGAAELYFVGDDGAPLRQKVEHNEFVLTIVPPEDAELPSAGAALRRLGKGPPPGRDAILALDGVRLVLEGLTKAKSPLREKLSDALEGTGSFESVTGELTWRKGRPVRRLFVVAGRPKKGAK